MVELHGFSKEEEGVEASVNDVSPLADGGPPSSILKDCFAPELQKSRELRRHSLTYHPRLLLQRKGGKKQVERYSGALFRGGSVQVGHFDTVSMSADILQYD